MIIESINALTKKLTGQDGTGSDITESINDLTKKWTGSNERGETIAEALDVLAQHAEGGGGGGGDYPTFTLSGGSWSCDMTYEEAKASYMASADENHNAPVLFLSNPFDEGIQIREWCVDVLATGEQLSGFVDVPETVTEGLAILSLSEELMPIRLYAEDGNFYPFDNN